MLGRLLQRGIVNVCLALAGGLLLAAPCTAGAVEVRDANIGAITQVSNARVTRVLFDYSYRAQIVNGKAALRGVVASVSSRSPNTVIRDGAVDFGDVPANSTLTSVDTFTIRQDRQFPFNPADLVWTIQAAERINTAPTADPGVDRNVLTTDSVTLDGSASRDAEGDSLTFIWSFVSRPSGSGATFNDPQSRTPFFVADKIGTYVVRLVVNDGAVDSAPAQISIVAQQKTVQVPNLVDRSIDDTDAALIAAGLLPGAGPFEPSTTVRQGHVIRQTPTPGQVVSVGSRVDRVFSSGGGWVNCPVSGVPLAARCVVEDGPSRLSVIASFIEDDVLDFSLARDGVVHLREQGLETFDLSRGAVTEDQLISAQYNAATRGIRLLFSEPQLFISEAVIYLDDTGAGSELAQAVTLTALKDFRTRAVVYTDFTLGGETLDQSVVIDGGKRLVQSNGALAATFEITGLPAPEVYAIASADSLGERFTSEDLFVRPDNSVVTGPGALASVFAWDLMIRANGGATIRGVTRIFTGTGETVAMPDVLGQTEELASAAVTAAGLEVGSVEYRDASAAHAGSIVAQVPVAGVLVPQGFPVHLAAGADLFPVPVPNVVGGGRLLADLAFRFSLLEMGLVRAVASTSPIGTILSQQPPAGALVPRGSAVDITLSSGLYVPHVEKLELDAARQILESAGYQVGTVTADRTTLLPIGKVSRQQPVSGFAAPAGSQIALFVSAEVLACPCVVPDLEEFTREEAIALIERAGLDVGSVTVVRGSGYPANTVISQSLDAGSVAQDGSAVDFAVAEDEGFVTCPNIGSVYTCRVEDGDAVFTLVVDLAQNEILDYDLTIGGIRHVTRQEYFLFDSSGDDPDSEFLAPMQRTSTATVRVAEDYESLREATSVTLSSTGSGARLDIELRFDSELDGPVTGRVYGYTDFALGGTTTDPAAFVANTQFLSSDGSFLGRVSASPGVTGSQAAVRGQLADPLNAGVAIDLSDVRILLEDGDFEHAFVWEVTLRPDAPLTLSATTLIEIARAPQALVITSVPDVQVLEDQPYRYFVDVAGGELDFLQYELGAHPSGMTIDRLTGEVSWTPTNVDVGVHPVEVAVTGVFGATVMQSFRVGVENVNDAPGIVSVPLTQAVVGEGYIYRVVATDIDRGDELTYSLATWPAGMAIDEHTGVITWLPDLGSGGFANVEIIARDLAGASVAQAFSIDVDVRVPDVVGIAEADATSRIVLGGLKPRLLDRDVSTTVVAGFVLSQQPQAGLVVPAGADVGLVLSTGEEVGRQLDFSGPPPVELSDLAALPVDEDTGLPVAIEIPGMRVLIDLERKDPITGLGECLTWVTACVQPEQDRSLDDCVRSVPRCSAADPWLDTSLCCPTACYERYRSLRLSGTARFEAFERVLFGGNSCYPGVEGEVP